eukprot:TRINITY_DN30204_c1_g1_i1.p1 TRINITY_DN30204_c1_g1~~TRINITY_DN30204_c1_g1_i1.p1  ORF type:complete len:518 (+),score=139.30 TRINITY_DN30204_c1_g1_i1:35-1555(+)
MAHIFPFPPLPKIYPDLHSMDVTKLQQREGEVEDAQPQASEGVAQEECGAPGAARRRCVCLVSDFFFPCFGGVEIHIFNLAHCLVQLGLKVVIITRSHGDRQGVRWATGGIKVYYLTQFALQLPPGTITLPTVYSLLPVMRNIFIREGVDVVHGHQTTSNLAHEAMLHATTMGIPTVFTDHSLFGFHDGSSIHINKVMQWSLSHVSHVICVSHTCRANTALRAKILPEKISVIPNATDPAKFTPDPSWEGLCWGDILKRRTSQRVTIVAVTRLVYRKGADLLVDVVPMVCAAHPNVDWIIGGNGPRLLQVEQMVERHNLFDRVTLLGEVKHEEVPGVLRRGQIFLNTSLTEAFCIAICEAAACGLLVVSTRVGGVPEVLPSDMLILAEPSPASLASGLDEALKRFPEVWPWGHHSRIASMYNWRDIAQRTVRVYNRAEVTPIPRLADRIATGFSMGCVYGIVCAGLTALDHGLWTVAKYLSPAGSIHPAPDMPPLDSLPQVVGPGE